MSEFRFPNQVPPAVDERIRFLERAVKELESRLSILETVDIGEVARPRRGRPPKIANER